MLKVLCKTFSLQVLAVFMVCRDNVEDPLDDSGTVQQQLDQVKLFCVFGVLYLTSLIVQW